ncbi:MAG: beta-propeller fold lactonase family protein, partial [Mobilitalea sp.]
YGIESENTVVLYHIEDNGTARVLWQDSIANASFVCTGEDYLFTITEEEDYAEIYLYRQTGDSYQFLDSKRIEGGLLCHIAYSPKNKALYGACYGSGTIFAVQVEKDCFGELLYHEIQQTSESKALTRAHCVLLNKAETQLITVNIAQDMICYYDISEGKLTYQHQFSLPKGVGPRHAVLSRDEKLLYIITEYSNEIFVYENFGEHGLLQHISTLSEEFKGISNCSAICFSKNHDYLYAANRGADTITLLEVEKNGTLIRRTEYDCGGKHPRHMMISKDGNYLVINNQNSNNVAIDILDNISGAIRTQFLSIEFAAPSGVVEQ